MASRRSLWPAADQGIRKACGPTAHMHAEGYVPSVTTVTTMIDDSQYDFAKPPSDNIDFPITKTAEGTDRYDVCRSALLHHSLSLCSEKLLLSIRFAASSLSFPPPPPSRKPPQAPPGSCGKELSSDRPPPESRLDFGTLLLSWVNYLFLNWFCSRAN